MRISDWSSDVGSSELGLVRRGRHRHVVGDHHDLGFQVDAVTLVDHLDAVARAVEAGAGGLVHKRIGVEADRKSVVSGTSVEDRVDLGGRRTIKQNKCSSDTYQHTTAIHKKQNN